MDLSTTHQTFGLTDWHSCSRAMLFNTIILFHSCPRNRVSLSLLIYCFRLVTCRATALKAPAAVDAVVQTATTVDNPGISLAIATSPDKVVAVVAVTTYNATNAKVSCRKPLLVTEHAC